MDWIKIYEEVIRLKQSSTYHVPVQLEKGSTTFKTYTLDQIKLKAFEQLYTERNEFNEHELIQLLDGLHNTRNSNPKLINKLYQKLEKQKLKRYEEKV